ncbi:MAG: response regulator, partial [bacterium]
EDSIRKQLKELGEKLGFSVLAARDGLEAWEMFRKWQPDLVAIDIYMPRMNGLTVFHKIKEISPATPVIMITGFLHYEQLIQKDRLKPDGFLTKPFRMDDIANMMLNLVCNRKEEVII